MMIDQFQRTILLLGEEAFQKIVQTRVTIIGLGAVGSFATEALARAGVGFLRLVDHDRVQPSNLNRQLFALHSSLGQLKADLAQARVADINPQCQCEKRAVFANKETIPQLVKNTDLVIDAIDSLNPKVDLLEYCFKNDIKIISSMGAARRTDLSKIRFGDLFSCTGCPLARMVRKRLRRRGVLGPIEAVFSEEHAPPLQNQAELPIDEERFFQQGRSSPPLGSMPAVTGIFGLYLAHQAIQQIIKLD